MYPDSGLQGCIKSTEESPFQASPQRILTYLYRNRLEYKTDKMAPASTLLRAAAPAFHAHTSFPSHNTPTSSSNRTTITNTNPINSTSSTPFHRIQTIAKHMALPQITSFPAEVVPQAPEDPLFGLARAFKADPSPQKVDLVCCLLSHGRPHARVVQITQQLLIYCFQGIGAYRDENAKPWVLPVVKKVSCRFICISLSSGVPVSSVAEASRASLCQSGEACRRLPWAG